MKASPTVLLMISGSVIALKLAGSGFDLSSFGSGWIGFCALATHAMERRNARDNAAKANPSAL